MKICIVQNMIYKKYYGTYICMYFKTYCFEEIQLRILFVRTLISFMISTLTGISVLLFDKTTEILILFVFICSISCLTIIMDCFTPIELNKCIQYTGSCYLKLVLFLMNFLGHLSHSGDLLLWVGVSRRASSVVH